jgi:hypothetical protein
MTKKSKRFLIAHTVKTGVVCFCFCLFFLAGRTHAAEDMSLFNLTSKQKAEVEQILLDTSKKINKQLPVMVDEDSRLDLSMALGTHMTYKYTMINHDEDYYDSEVFSETIKNNILYTQCSNKDMLLLLRSGVEYNFLYFGKDNRQITQIKINIDNCSNL